MLMVCRMPGFCFLGAMVCSLVLAPMSSAQVKKKFAFRDHPLIPAFERFFSAPGTDPVKGGQLLLGELNCLSCHKADKAVESLAMPKMAPILDNVGGRIKRSYLKQFLTDPQAAKPGTAMPNLLADLPEKDRKQKVEALVHFLSSTGSLKPDRPDRKLITQGRDIYHKIGCVACHATRDAAGGVDKALPTSVPMAKTKFTLGSLAAFLENPHQVRPSGRMPGLLKAEETKKVANYLLQGTSPFTVADNMAYSYYQGHWDKLPDFATLKPLSTGKTSDFDVGVARRSNDMAIRFEGYLKIERGGQYRFHLTSDDGSKLFIDGLEVATNDGIHPPTTAIGRAQLTKGMHKLVAGVFNAGGGVELAIDIEGQGLKRQPISPMIFLTTAGPPKIDPDKKDEENFPLQAELIDQGRQLFAALGCANCHQLTLDKKPITSALLAPKLAQLRAEGGCLAPTPQKTLPWYGFNGLQRTALAAAIKTPPPPPLLKGGPGGVAAPQEIIARTLTAFNCYACHDRDKIGGPEEAMNPFFSTTQPEMGDEGRIPPTLTGAGAKLTNTYLREILDKGGHSRPYMHTHMPRFGQGNVGHLVALFAQVDTLAKAPAVAFKQTSARIKAEARKIVGEQSLSCIKCHTFAGHKAEGVQGIDLTVMTQHLKRDWFYHYLLDPNKYRPGTRMPTAWPNGQSVLPTVLDGNADKQIEAIWLYLGDGKQAQLPKGLKKQSIPLIPDKEAIIYRNFIEGAGPRAIAVGFPEKAHLAFDANDLRLALIWQGDFIDAARHWTDRGAGFEPPMGDNIVHLPKGVAFYFLAAPNEPWPQKSAAELGYRFRGYRLTPDQRPTFLYTLGDVQVEDTPNAVAGKTPTLRRKLVLTAKPPVVNLYYRAAAAAKIDDLGKGWYGINDEWKMRLDPPASPRIRRNGGQMELLVPVLFQNGRAVIGQEFVW